jgi:phosphonate utilization transcriptional regulator
MRRLLDASIVDNLQPTGFNGNMFKPGSDPARQGVRARAGVRRVATPSRITPDTGAANSPTILPGSGRRRTLGDDHPIALIQQNSLPALVQRELERMILAGDLPAGSKLREVEVASMLGVSRGPVREAFRALEESGLVRLEKNRGVFVRQIGIDEADQIFELRAVLEEFAGRRAAHNATPAQAAELRALVDRMETAVAGGDVDGYHAANLAFHDRIIDLAGNPKLAFVYRRLVNELHLHRRAALAQTGILPVSMREHRTIVDHIAARQSAAAGRALHEHAMASRERVHTSVAPAARSRKAAR